MRRAALLGAAITAAVAVLQFVLVELPGDPDDSTELESLRPGSAEIWSAVAMIAACYLIVTAIILLVLVRRRRQSSRSTTTGA